MKKNTYLKLGAILIILGLFVPVIATAIEPTSLKVYDKKPTLNASNVDADTATITAATKIVVQKKIIESQTTDFGSFNMMGKWGSYDSFLDDTFIAQKDNNDIFGRVSRNNGEYTYFFITIRPIFKTFMGIVFEGDEFHSITGRFINKDGKFNAMWEMNNGLDGWFVGKLI